MLPEKQDSLKPFSSTDVDAYELNLCRKQSEFLSSSTMKPQNRHEKFPYEKYLKKPKEIDRSDTFFQNSLRKKFVDTAKKYIGTPYNRKYLQPSNPNYDSPMFLDCCGLVRQVVQDLKDEFGFILGPWNQAYQFDTLPNELEFEEMKPGDLIFYSGRYHDRKRRRNAHDMVHVEIFLGGESGFQTIAARRREGVVEVFDDFRFRSTIYYNVRHYFKSIDTWLQGICKSHCKKHNWIENDMWWSEKYSFYPDQNDEEKENGFDSDHIFEIEKEVKPVYLGKGNNYKLFKSFFNNEKWAIMNRYENLSTNYYFKWVPLIHEIDFTSFQEGKQIVNHLPNSKIISSKTGLIYLLREYESYSSSSDINSKMFMPRSFILENEEERRKFLEEKLEGIWIYKPMNLYRNRRVRIISDTERFKQDFQEKQKIINYNNPKENLAYFLIKKQTFSAGNQSLIPKRNTKSNIRTSTSNNRMTLLQNINNFRTPLPKSTMKLPIIQRAISQKKSLQPSQFPPIKSQTKEIEEPTKDYVFKYKYLSSKAIFQKYIDKPFLFEGRKCELRCFVLIASTKPFLILFHHGYIKLSLDKYKIDKDVEEKKKKFMHLVNSHIQKKHPNYFRDKEKTSLNMDTFEGYLQENRKMSLPEIENIYMKIKKILGYIFTVASRKLERKKGYFELYGCDFIFDENLNPFLMDISSNPSLLIETNTHLEVIPLLIKKVLEFVISINDPKNQENFSKNLEEMRTSSRFEILFNEIES